MKKILTKEEFVLAGRKGKFYIIDNQNNAVVDCAFDEDMYEDFDDYEDFHKGLGDLLKNALDLCVKNNPTLYKDVAVYSLEFLTLINADTIDNNIQLFDLINSSNEYKVVAFVGHVNITEEEDIFYDSFENKFMKIDISGEFLVGEKIAFHEIDLDLEFDLKSIELFS